MRDSALTQENSGYSIRTKRYRYTQWSDGGKNMTELYDWKTDPDEMINLAENPEYKAAAETLKSALAARVSAAKTVPAGVRIIKPNKQK